MVLRFALTPSVSFGYGGVTLSASASQHSSPTNFHTLYCAPYNPSESHLSKVWAPPSSLALLRESLRFLFLQVLRFFSSLRSPPKRIVFIAKDWVSPFGHPRINARLTTPRGLSQPFYVLLRHPAPRHPPCTLSSLIKYL